MTKRNVMIQISTSRIAIATQLFNEMQADEEDEEFPQEADNGMPEATDMWMEGRLVTGAQRVELVYEETELSGMDGSVTSIGFDREAPTLITMMRSGPVSTAMVFEEGKRHFCVYDTPFSSFQICVRALEVDNRLLSEGLLILEYQIEVQGAQAERCRMTVRISDDKDLFEET